MNVQPETLFGSTIMLNMKAICDKNAPCVIVATDRDKKIAIEKAVRAASRMVVSNWPSYLY